MPINKRRHAHTLNHFWQKLRNIHRRVAGTLGITAELDPDIELELESLLEYLDRYMGWAIPALLDELFDPAADFGTDQDRATTVLLVAMLPEPDAVRRLLWITENDPDELIRQVALLSLGDGRFISELISQRAWLETWAERIYTSGSEEMARHVATLISEMIPRDERLVFALERLAEHDHSPDGGMATWLLETYRERQEDGSAEPVEPTEPSSSLSPSAMPRLSGPADLASSTDPSPADQLSLFDQLAPS